MYKYGVYKTQDIADIRLTYTWADGDAGAPTPVMLISMRRGGIIIGADYGYSNAVEIKLTDMFKYDNPDERNRYLAKKGKQFAQQVGGTHSQQNAYKFMDAIMQGLADLFRMPPATSLGASDSAMGEIDREVTKIRMDMRHA